MKAIIGKSIAKGRIEAPASKSYAHRLLICAALSGGGVISNVELSDDIKATLECLDNLGFLYEIDGKTVKFNGRMDRNDTLYCNESGSTLRFLIPVAMAIYGHAHLSGKEKLFQRGLGIYEDLFIRQNIKYTLNKDSIEINGKLSSGLYEIDASISSQFITGLLLTLPMLDGDSEIKLIGKIESKPYLDITVDCLQKSGIDIKEVPSGYKIKGNQTYALKRATVEADYSNAAFIDGLNLLGGSVEITNLNHDSKQGDKVYKEIYPKLINGSPIIDLSNAIDLGPILFSLAAYFNGATFVGIERLRIKESNRIDDTLKLLDQFGASYYQDDKQVIINKYELHKPENDVVVAKDHRLVMSAAILLTAFGGTILNIEAVNKSYPNFFRNLRALGVDVKYEE